MVNAKNVQLLNDRIEKINNQRVKAETQHEMLTKRLNTELDSYKEQFGVDLVGKSFTETRKKINAEIKKVTSEVEAEYKLKEKVVNAIEAGDVKEAYRLLGIEVKAEEPEEELLKEPEQVLEEALSTPTLEKESSTEKSEDLGLSAGDDFGFGDLDLEVEAEEEPSIEEPKKVNSNVSMSPAMDAIGDLEVEGDDEDEFDSDFGFGDLMKGTKFELGGE